MSMTDIERKAFGDKEIIRIAINRHGGTRMQFTRGKLLDLAYTPEFDAMALEAYGIDTVEYKRRAYEELHKATKHGSTEAA
jgi:hypothetical protein